MNVNLSPALAYQLGILVATHQKQNGAAARLGYNNNLSGLSSTSLPTITTNVNPARNLRSGINPVGVHHSGSNALQNLTSALTSVGSDVAASVYAANMHGVSQSADVPSLPLAVQAIHARIKQAAAGGAQSPQFMHNYAFNNSGNFHQKPFDAPKVGPAAAGGTAGPGNVNLRENLQQALLQHLSNSAASAAAAGIKKVKHKDKMKSGKPVESVKPQTPVPTVISPQEQSSSTSESDSPRGVKRTLPSDPVPSEQTKRPCNHDEGKDESSTVTPVPHPLKLDELEKTSNVIWEHYNRHHQSQGLYSRKMQLREALYTIMKGVFPYCGLYVVGSSMNGFGANTSDMDMCLMLSQSEIDQKREAFEILRVIHMALRRCSFLKELMLIRAKVPILKFTDRYSGVECDLNINNSVGIRNTHLLNVYSKLDWRVGPLVLFVKYWAKCHNINDASKSTISSYSLVLMVLHYLQVGCTPPVIPSLQKKYPHKFDDSLDVRLLTLNDSVPEHKTENQESLGELFMGFIDYYANIFDYELDGISVRLGRVLPRSIMSTGHPDRTMWKCLCIEEPFDKSNTARSVYDANVFKRVERVIRQSYQRLRKTGDIYKILNEPL